MLEAKVPSVKRRISCVYADLRELFSEMELLALSLKATEEHATSSHVRSTLRFENDVNMYGTQAESGGLRTVG